MATKKKADYYDGVAGIMLKELEKLQKDKCPRKYQKVYLASCLRDLAKDAARGLPE